MLIQQRRAMTWRAACTAYVILAGAALALIFIAEVAPLAGEAARWPADVLGFPWSFLVRQIADPGAFGEVMLRAAGMALNLAILAAIGRWAEGRSRGEG